MTRLKRFSKNENGRKKIIIGIYAFLIIGIILTGASYAVYQREAEVLFINATVGEFKENDIELAIKLNGEQVDTPPTKDNYTVTVDCDNADGSWDANRWGANVDNIRANKVKCEVNFVTPEPTLSTVTATAEKTSINLSYTAGGIGTSTTCVYGTEEGNYESSVEEVQNTSCNITGLDYDTTYYYKVCAKNAGGEVCKEGSIKTKPEGLAGDVELGDYISMTPTATLYTIGTEVTGYTSAQTINPSELNLWRVIRKNADGTVDMVSDKVSSQGVYFQGKTGYINFVGGLNAIAAQYTDEKHVQSTRHIGYGIGTTLKITDQTKLTTDIPWTNSTSSSWTSSSSGFTEEEEKQGAGDIGYTTDYNLVNTVYGSMKGYKVGTNDEVSYWLASRKYEKVESRNQYIVSGRLVNLAGELYGGWIFSMYKGNITEGYNGYSVRPIVTLKSTSKILSGSGTSSSPYKLL